MAKLLLLTLATLFALTVLSTTIPNPKLPMLGARDTSQRKIFWTDLKQDNSYDIANGGQSPRYKNVISKRYIITALLPSPFNKMQCNTANARANPANTK